MKDLSKVIEKIPACPNPTVPGPAGKLVHLTDIQLRFTDIDMIGHVNNNAYLQYMDLAKTMFFADLIDGDMSWRNPNALIVNINISFYAQAFMGERLGVLTGVVSISEKSFTIEQRVVNLETGVVNCVAHTVMVSYCKETMKSAPIDDEWRKALTDCMGQRV